MVSSPVIKFLEGYIAPELKKYATSRMHRGQYAFYSGSSIDLCKRSAFSTIKTRINLDKTTYGLFIDFKSAYDSVDRVRLIQLIFDNNILRPESLKLLQFLLPRLRIQLGD